MSLTNSRKAHVACRCRYNIVRCFPAAAGHQLQLLCRCLISSLVCFLKSNRNEHEELAAWLCVPPLRLTVALGGCISLVYNRAAVYNSRFVMASLDGLNYHLIPVISIVRCG
jgi:hypothetical protein